MKITKMRFKKGIPSTDLILDIERDLKQRFAKIGFVTNVNTQTRTSIRIGLHMRSFSLDLAKWDRNLQCNPHAAKLTNLPTWDQRVLFNNIVNSVLNKYKVSANVKSGPYIIRQGRDAMTESDWFDQKPEWTRHNEARGYYIESVDEKQYLEDRRIRRNKQSTERRAQANLIAKAERRES